jgi:hypothetical protein
MVGAVACEWEIADDLGQSTQCYDYERWGENRIWDIMGYDGI